MIQVEQSLDVTNGMHGLEVAPRSFPSWQCRAQGALSSKAARSATIMIPNPAGAWADLEEQAYAVSLTELWAGTKLPISGSAQVDRCQLCGRFRSGGSVLLVSVGSCSRIARPTRI